MSNEQLSNIFNEPVNGYQNHQEQLNFLFLEDIFYVESYSPRQDNPFYEESSAHFVDIFSESDPHRENVPMEPQTETPNEFSKPVFKSSYTKNACFNICQKTIKVIKKGVFQDKLASLCESQQIEIEEFKAHIMKKKKDFTGPKALSSYLEKNSGESRVFSEFMKWFLTEKYLRMAINEGQMKDLSKYIEYKNHFILPLLN